MQNNKPLYILSPCGTSLLTNVASSGQGKAIFPNSNARQPEDISPHDLLLLEELLAAAAVKLQKADQNQAAQLSAELNSLLKIVVRETSGSAGNNFYQLLCTDTWLGEETAKIVQQWLKNQRWTVEIKRQTDLQTNIWYRKTRCPDIIEHPSRKYLPAAIRVCMAFLPAFCKCWQEVTATGWNCIFFLQSAGKRNF